ncbi:hypothetical protein GGQ85_002319 [Nitrobacter vulgaris]|nr:hypothetical protein [Nitrobacter vulgaris]
MMITLPGCGAGCEKSRSEESHDWRGTVGAGGKISHLTATETVPVLKASHKFIISYHSARPSLRRGEDGADGNLALSS